MRRAFWITASLAIALLLLLPSSGATKSREKSFRVQLVGFEEVPAISTEGVGQLVAKLNPSENELTFELDYEDLSGTPSAAHVHLGQRGVNGAPMFFLCGGGGKPACPGGASGTVTGTVRAVDIIGPSAQGIAAGEFDEVLLALRAGVAYANVHTGAHPGGEIRGQIKEQGLALGRR